MPSTRPSPLFHPARKLPRLDRHLGVDAALRLLDPLEDRRRDLGALLLAREQHERRLWGYLAEEGRQIALEVVLAPALGTVDHDHAATGRKRHRRQGLRRA